MKGLMRYLLHTRVRKFQSAKATLCCLIWLASALVANIHADSNSSDSFPDVLVSGNKSLLRYDADYPFWYPVSRKQRVCTSFYVSSRAAAVAQVIITSSGLGAVTFEAPAPTTQGCPDSSPGEQFQLMLPTLEGTRKILMRVAADDVPTMGNAVEGRIIVASAKQKPQEIPIKLENPASPFRTAWLWVWGILIPGGITFGFGYLAAVASNWFSTRRSETQAFEKYRDTNYPKLDSFFTGVYKVCEEKPSDRAFASSLRSELIKDELLVNLPRYQRRKLEKQIRQSNRAKLKLLLAQLFPEWEAQINAPKEHQEQTGNDS